MQAFAIAELLGLGVLRRLLKCEERPRMRRFPDVPAKYEPSIRQRSGPFTDQGSYIHKRIIAFTPQLYYKRPPSQQGGCKVMQQEPLNLVEFQRKFSTEASCVEHLFRLRWPGGYHCPRCGHGSYCFHSTRRLYQCSKCKYQVSVTAGTIFHKTRTPLMHWFWMIFMMARQRSGLSMLSCQRMLGIKTYKTVWTMGHKIRKAMEDRDSQYQLAGLVEMDEAFIGPKKPGPRGRGAKGKATVVIAVESHDKHAGFAVMRHVPSADSDQILSVAEDKILSGSNVRTDGWRAYQALGSNGFVHESIIVSKNKEALKQLKWVHVLTANVKGNIRGVYHGVSEKHLGRYLAEFSYRFNRRAWDSQLFNRTVTACLTTSTVTFAELKA